MKTLFLKLSILILLTGLSFNAFTQTINIDSTFYSDTEIYPFSGVDSIYGLSITGNITLNSDTSLVRVILVDENYNEYMVYEAYPLITTSMDFDVTNVCDETCCLAELNPYSIIIQIVGGSLFLNDLTLSYNYYADYETISDSLKTSIETVKVGNINTNNNNNNSLWGAGLTEIGTLWYSDKKNLFGDKYNLQGFDYYNGGIFTIGTADNFPNDNSSLVEQFDWRTRHGANNQESPYFNSNGNGWITSIKKQWDLCYGTCFIYGPVAAFEAVINLYYNEDEDQTIQINTNLSEQYALSCGDAGGCGGGSPGLIQDNIIRDNGIMDEECCENQQEGNEDEIPCDDIIICEYPEYKIQSTGNMEELFLFDEIKQNLILYGPSPAAMIQPINWQHSMALVGYGKLKEGDIIHRGIYLDPEPVPSGWIGKTYWIFKNSWGTDYGDNGYVYCMLNTYGNSPYIDDVYPFITPLYQLGTVNLSRMCLDKDADGYYNWGVDPKPVEVCPTCPEKIDSDDWDPRIGPFDDNYYGIPVAPEMVVMCENEVIDDDGFFTFYEAIDDRELIITINNNGNAQLNLQAFSTVISSEPSIFEITPPPPSYQVEMDGETQFIIYYHNTIDPGIDQAVITIYTEEPEYGEFEFVIANYDCNQSPGPDINITESGTWETNGIITGNVFVHRNAELIIEGQYGFIDGIDLNIKTGGRVIIDGGVLTNVCDNPWQGIDVWGDVNVSQYPTSNQGYLEIINSGKIQNAEFGIEVANANGDFTYANRSTGGIVKCDSAIFRNNQYDIVIFPYQNINPGTDDEISNFCSFNNSQFFSDAGFCNPEYHVNLIGVDGIKFRACSFENKVNLEVYPAGFKRGIGIASYNSGFYVKDYCTNNTVPCDNTNRSLFENLEYGIYAFNGELSKYISIDTTVFVNNKTGIYMSMVENQSVTRNQFIYDDAHDLSGDTPVGLYLETCTGYSIEENIFGNNAQDLTSLGIQILNSGSAYNEIYNNTFENLNTGISAAGENRGPTGEGLCVKCNDFKDCANDIYITDEGGVENFGIAFAQGEEAPQPPPNQDPDPTYAAGNNFSDFTGINYNYINLEACNQIQYTYHGNYDNNIYKLVPDPRYPPAPSTHIYLKPDNEVWYNSKSDACPSSFGSVIDFTAEKNMLASESINVDAYQDTLSIFVDGGDTDGLNLGVQLSFPNEALEVRQELLDESPYLSDTVMKTAIEKESVLPNVMIRDVLVANPQSAKSAKIISALDERFVSMPDYMMNEIMQGQTVYGAKELLEQQLSKHKTNRDKSLSTLIRHYSSDTTNITASTDSIISLFQNQNYSSSRYRLAILYFCENDSANAFSTLNNIPVEFDLTEKEEAINDLYLDLFNIQWEITSDTNGIDSLQIATLFDIANHQYTIPGVYARNILINAREIIYNELVYLPVIFKVIPIWHKGNNNVIKPYLLKVFPNPARNYFIVEYKLDKAIEKPYLILTEMGGKPIKSIYISNKQNQIIVSTKDLPSGIYIIQLVGNKKVLESKKLTINN
ncbi:MAG: T9SS type A sorting domain-containing protein [Bacteroidales bacterium]|nr:T9SS type A sorting domain-containing protein [Bacteroidales bacterium]